MTSAWQTTRFQIDLTRPRVMGIVNVTPDSFSDSGSYACATAALRHCEQLIKEGADILDIGGESTRPGSSSLSLEEELKRVLPVVQEAVKFNVPVSVDSYKSEVMRAVLDLGADIVNDIWALRQPGAREVVTRHPSCGVCLMHMHGIPQTMQIAPMSDDVMPQVLQFLKESAQALLDLKFNPARIVLDPGIGFGKTVVQNFSILARQAELLTTGFPVLAGWSRKSALGVVTGVDPASQRMVPSVSAAILAVERGARIVRVHDVRETVMALAVWNATQKQT
jgi:dihydropteroate synthase